MKYWFGLLFLGLGIWSCQNSPPSTTTPSAGDSTNGGPSARQGAVTFSLEAKEGPWNPATDQAKTDVFLSASVWSRPVLLTQENGYSVVEHPDFDEKKIPTEAAFAFSCWYAGGGYDYYGVQKGQELKVYRRWEDEVSAPHSEPWEVFKTLSLEKDPAPVVDHYICFTEDEGKSPDLSVAYGPDDKALHVQYKGQASSITLEFVKEIYEEGGAHPNIGMEYNEKVDGQVTGSYLITHSGNWDYVEYTRAKDKKVFHFTINHDASLSGDAYRTTPCF